MNIRATIEQIAHEHMLEPEDALKKSREAHLIACRRDIAKALHEQGMTIRGIARIFGLSEGRLRYGVFKW